MIGALLLLWACGTPDALVGDWVLDPAHPPARALRQVRDAAVAAPTDPAAAAAAAWAATSEHPDAVALRAADALLRAPVLRWDGEALTVWGDAGPQRVDAARTVDGWVVDDAPWTARLLGDDRLTVTHGDVTLHLRRR